MLKGFIGRVKGVVEGVKCGVLAPLVAPMSLIVLARGEHKSSGAGPALALMAGGFGGIWAGILFGLSVGGGCLLQMIGIPWFLTIPTLYFAGWGVTGAILFNEPR